MFGCSVCLGVVCACVLFKRSVCAVCVLFITCIHVCVCAHSVCVCMYGSIDIYYCSYEKSQYRSCFHSLLILLHTHQMCIVFVYHVCVPTPSPVKHGIPVGCFFDLLALTNSI